MTERAAENEPDKPALTAAVPALVDPIPAEAPEDRGTIYFLGIFLLLLAFFILLGAIARQDAIKTRGVMSSVAATFRTQTEPKDVSELFVSQLGRIPEPAVLLEGLEGLWVTAVPVTRVEVLQPGRTMELSLPLREVFVARTALMRSDREELLKHTVAALSVPYPDQVLQFWVIAGPEAKPRPGEAALAFERAVAFAGVLNELGAPPAPTAVGVEPADKGRVRLRFAFRDRTAAAVTFAGPVPEAGQ